MTSLKTLKGTGVLRANVTLATGMQLPDEGFTVITFRGKGVLLVGAKIVQDLGVLKVGPMNTVKTMMTMQVNA